MPMRMGNGKINAGVLNSSDSSTSEMSYVDMHDLHPENVQAAQVHGAVQGAVEGGTLGGILGGITALAIGDGKRKSVVRNAMDAATALVTEGEEGGIGLSRKGVGIGFAIMALGAIAFAGVRAYTAKKDAETHNEWSNRVLTHMETKEAAENNQRAAAVLAERTATAGPMQVG